MWGSESMWSRGRGGAVGRGQARAVKGIALGGSWSRRPWAYSTWGWVAQ
jgi:hypothetical protein